MMMMIMMMMMIRNVDLNKNGAVDFNEFITMMSCVITRAEDDVSHAFKVRNISPKIREKQGRKYVDI